MKTKVLTFNLAIAVVAIVVASAFTSVTDWKIPAEYKSKKNPVKSSATSIQSGKDVYASKCKSCHGLDGKKNGDFTTAAFKAKTDGEMYYMSFIGNGKMPNMEKKVADENDRWHVVNYIKSMK